jgi:hypothetical protein
MAAVSTLADVFRVLIRMQGEGVVLEYAIGGATAVLFYAEPTRTYDVDVFVILRPEQEPLAVPSGVYDWARDQGFALDSEHLIVHGVPVQILPRTMPL